MRATSILWEQSGRWRLIRTGRRPENSDLASIDDPPGLVAEALANALAARRALKDELVLAFEGASVLSATIALPPRTARDRDAVAFALEEALPLSAEEMVCDYCISTQGVFGVVLELIRGQPLVEAILEQGLRIRSISPWPLLALQRVAPRITSRQRQLVVWQMEEAVHLFVIDGNTPLDWRLAAAEPQAVLRELEMLRQIHSNIARITPISLETSILAAVGNFGIAVADGRQDLMDAMAIEMCERISTRRQQALIELRRMPLGNFDPFEVIRRPLHRALTGCLMLLAAAAGGLWLQADRYDQAAAELQTQQVEIFRELFPGQRTPTGVHRRLESEYRQLAAVTGRSTDMPELKSAWQTLGRALLSLPDELRFRALELRGEPSGVTLEGEVRQHGDADLLAARLRQAGFEVVPPRTERAGDKQNQAVNYSLSAQIPGEPSSATQLAGGGGQRNSN